MGPLKAAGWWILDYAYALVWQSRALFDRTDPASFATGTQAPIVILPGIYETWKFMQPIVEELHDRGHPVHVLEMLERNLHPVAEMADLVTDYLHRNGLRDVTIVAHSKGGLAGKLVMIGTAGDQVRGMVAVATPFGGSRYARMMPSRTLRALAPKDPVILRLAQELATNRKIVSIYARFDPHIPEGSELSGATNIRVDTGGHFRILAHPQVIDELGALSGKSSPGDPTCVGDTD
ncbi:esterase/lipase family protein [Microbacterium sp. TWP3-1-2b2]|uniref:esterase/lipase family protein n=1 Tax=Microbacterium sp. TWP3-1-2b2 TaxID=2804651 RepID=UPI003CED9EFF